MKRKAIIIGATGQVGRALTRELTALYDMVTLISRTQPDFFGANMQCYTLSDFDRLAQVLSAVSVDERTDAFCCLWLDKQDAISDEEMGQVHYEYPYQFAWQLRQKGVRRFFLLSKQGADKQHKDAILAQKGRLEEAIAGLQDGQDVGFELVARFQVGTLLLSEKNDSFASKLKQWGQYTWGWLAQAPLSPKQVAIAMTMTAYQAEYHQNHVQETANPLKRISHQQMLSLNGL